MTSRTPEVDMSPTGMLPIDVELLFGEAREPANKPRWVAWSAVVVAAIALLVMLAGCSTTHEQAVQVIVQGDALLSDPVADKVKDREWQERRAKFRKNAEPFVKEGLADLPAKKEGQ